MANGPFFGAIPAIAAGTTNDKYTIHMPAASASQQGTARVLEVRFTGQATATAAQQTRVVRPTTAGATPTALTLGFPSPNFVSPKAGMASAWTTQPVLPASGVGDLLNESWNAYGGLVRWLAAPGEEILVFQNMLTGQLSCRDVTSNGTGSYGAVWDEY